jgi:hypothetical protein
MYEKLNGLTALDLNALQNPVTFLILKGGQQELRISFESKAGFYRNMGDLLISMPQKNNFFVRDSFADTLIRQIKKRKKAFA